MGQAEIFALIDPAPAGVALTPSGLMVPRMSISFVLGIGPDAATATRACDLCALHASCRDQDHHAA